MPYLDPQGNEIKAGGYLDEQGNDIEMSASGGYLDDQGNVNSQPPEYYDRSPVQRGWEIAKEVPGQMVRSIPAMGRLGKGLMQEGGIGAEGISEAPAGNVPAMDYLESLGILASGLLPFIPGYEAGSAVYRYGSRGQGPGTVVSSSEGDPGMLAEREFTPDETEAHGIAAGLMTGGTQALRTAPFVFTRAAMKGAKALKGAGAAAKATRIIPKAAGGLDIPEPLPRTGKTPDEMEAALGLRPKKVSPLEQILEPEAPLARGPEDVVEQEARLAEMAQELEAGAPPKTEPAKAVEIAAARAEVERTVRLAKEKVAAKEKTPLDEMLEQSQRRYESATEPLREEGSKLPRRLAGAKPKWKDQDVDFTNDTEKALYIVAQEKKSKHDAAYREWVKNELGIDDAELDHLAGLVKKDITARMKGGKTPLDRIREDSLDYRLERKGEVFDEDIIEDAAIIDRRAPMPEHQTGKEAIGLPRHGFEEDVLAAMPKEVKLFLIVFRC